MPKDQIFKLRLAGMDRTRLESVASHHELSAAAVVRMLIRRELEAMERMTMEKKMATRKKTTNPLYDGASTCTCVEKMNAKLRELKTNTQLVTTLFTNHVALRVEKADAKVRQKPTHVLASFCPFCGVAYPIEKGQVA